MKKELWIQIISYKPNSDAAANRAFSFAKYFIGRGWKVNIVTNGTKNQMENDQGISIFRIKNTFYYKKKNFINRFIGNLVFLKGSKKIIKKNKESIFDSHYLVSSPELIPSKAGLLAKKEGATLIFDVRDIWPEVAIQMGAFSDNSLFARYFRKCANTMYKNCDYLTTVGNGKYDYLKSYDNGKYSNKVKLLNNGVDLDDLKISFDYSIFKKFNQNNQKCISYVGNVGSAQGLTTMLQIAKDHSDLLFLICGKGKELKSLQNNAKENNLLNVVFTGEITKPQALAITQSSTVSFISLQSPLMVDSVPTKLFESIALGTPVFLIASGEACDILQKSGMGEYTKPGDIERIKLSFNRFYLNLTKYTCNRESAYKYICEKYSRLNACICLEELLVDKKEQ